MREIYYYVRFLFVIVEFSFYFFINFSLLFKIFLSNVFGLQSKREI